MAATILDFPVLLAPFHADSPSGKDLRKEDFKRSLYHKIKDSRTLARTLERQQIQGAEVSASPDWSVIYKLSVQALSTETKDLEIAVWLIEALLREYGFAGLREGFKLIRELILHYWSNLYPIPDEDGMITRLAPLIGLNGEASEGTLIAPLALVSLTEGRSAGPFSLWQYQQALEIIKIADSEKRKQRMASGAVTFEMIAIAVAETPATFFQAQLQELMCCVDEFEKLTRVVEEKVGSGILPSSRILSQLHACIDCVKVIAKEKFSNQVENELAVSSEVVEKLNEIAETDSSIVALSGKETVLSVKEPTREAMLREIACIADFFRRTEPHSPISYLLERAVKWSKVPLPILLKELIKDEQALVHFCNLAGVPTEG